MQTTLTELQRYIDWRTRRLAARPPNYPVQKPGYLMPAQIFIMVPDARSGTGGGGGAPIPSLQSNLQRSMQGWVGMYGTFDAGLIRELIQGDADDSVAYLGPFDPDTDPARVNALVDEYVQIYQLAATPV